MLQADFRKAEGIDLTVPAKTVYINVVRLTIAAIGERMSFSVDDIEDIKVVVGEACINSIRHGYQGKESAENKIQIRFLIYPKKLKVVIKDNGKGFNTSDVDEYLTKSGDEKAAGIGLGVYLMKTLMDEVRYSSSSAGTKISMVKHE